MTTALIKPSVMTPKEFGRVFARLAIQLQWRDADIASADSYYVALKDYPLDVIEQSADQFARESGRRFFPPTTEWVEAANVVRLNQLRQAVTPSRSEPWHDECGNCQDTGWKPHNCPGGEDAECGRRKNHAAHPYVTPCPCRSVNRTYQRHQAFGAGQ